MFSRILIVEIVGLPLRFEPDFIKVVKWINDNLQFDQSLEQLLGWEFAIQPFTHSQLKTKMLTNKQPTQFELELEQSLNPAQFEAVCADESIPMCVYSGPGSGKTKVCSSSIRSLTSKRPSHTE